MTAKPVKYLYISAIALTALFAASSPIADPAHPFGRSFSEEAPLLKPKEWREIVPRIPAAQQEFNEAVQIFEESGMDASALDLFELGFWRKKLLDYLMMPGDPPDHILQTAENMAWYPTSTDSGRLYFLGQGYRTRAKFIQYDSTTNNWGELSLPLPCMNPTSLAQVCLGAAYDANALDAKSGKFYYFQQYSDVQTENVLFQYDPAAKRWTKSPIIPDFVGGAPAVAFFPDMYAGSGAVIVVGNRHVYAFNPATAKWATITSASPMGLSRVIAEYNPVRKVLIFGGGVGGGLGTGKKLYQLNAAGQLSALPDAPVDISVSNSVFGGGTLVTVDPVSGKYLIISNQSEMWEFDLVDKSFNKLFQTPQVSASAVAAPLPNLGVIAFMDEYDLKNRSEARMYLYKHSSAAAQSSCPTARGDINHSGAVDITDSVSLLSHLFIGQPLLPGEPDLCGDFDCSTKIDISDPVGILAYLFLGVTPTKCVGK